jgi:hypothetical protein
MDGTTSIPALTDNAEQLSKLTTLKEVREKWALKTAMIIAPTIPTTPFTVLFDLGKTKAFTPVLIKKKRIFRSIPTKRISVKRKKSRREFLRGNRRSVRLALNTEEEVSPTKISNLNLADDELLDVSQTRRLVRKCVARNKLKST